MPVMSDQHKAYAFIICECRKVPYYQISANSVTTYGYGNIVSIKSSGTAWKTLLFLRYKHLLYHLSMPLNNHPAYQAYIYPYPIS